jgi:hypothetical protein
VPIEKGEKKMLPSVPVWANAYNEFQNWIEVFFMENVHFNQFKPEYLFTLYKLAENFNNLESAKSFFCCLTLLLLSVRFRGACSYDGAAIRKIVLMPINNDALLTNISSSTCYYFLFNICKFWFNT